MDEHEGKARFSSTDSSRQKKLDPIEKMASSRCVWDGRSMCPFDEEGLTPLGSVLDQIWRLCQGKMSSYESATV